MQFRNEATHNPDLIKALAVSYAKARRRNKSMMGSTGRYEWTAVIDLRLPEPDLFLVAQDPKYISDRW